jgi:uncharacterized protein
VIGPAVAVISFVCSIGNVPLAAVLWNGGISFGGVVAFLLADLIVLPIVDIYRKYYGARVAALLFALFYVAMAVQATSSSSCSGRSASCPVTGACRCCKRA